MFFFHHSRRLPQRGPVPGKDRLTIPQAKRRQLLQFVSQLSRDLLWRDLSVNLQRRLQIGSAQAQARVLVKRLAQARNIFTRQSETNRMRVPTESCQ